MNTGNGGGRGNVAFSEALSEVRHFFQRLVVMAGRSIDGGPAQVYDAFTGTSDRKP